MSGKHADELEVENKRIAAEILIAALGKDSLLGGQLEDGQGNPIKGSRERAAIIAESFRILYGAVAAGNSTGGFFR